jgi:ubiquinone/menaquinone biosynthesis C-methylase UbiE
MESKVEAERLLQKSDEASSREQLVLTGLSRGMTAVDAGGGAGFVTRIIADLVGDHGKAIILDQSGDRLEAARAYCQPFGHIDFIQTSLEKILLPDASVDYIWCRFVFEYLKDPKTTFKEFIRIAKPGAKIVVADLDYNCMSHYPLEPRLEIQLREIASELERTKFWDPYAGRKIYSYYAENGLSDVQVRLIPHHLIYGESNPRDIANWKQKLEIIDQLTKAGTIRLSFDLEKFKTEFFKFFENPNRFSYSPLILVEGRK